MSPATINDALVAIIVTYEPDAGWPERLRGILNICARCIVVDNSVTPEARAFVRATVAGFATAELIANSDNFGLGRALNQGCRTLHETGHSWVVAFDQDSLPQPSLATALLATAASSPQPVAVVGANWQDTGRPGYPSRHLRAGAPFARGFRRVVAANDLADVLCVITSGSLFSLKAWHELNGFDEELFLDLVDTDFCLRARRAGWTISVSAFARLDHQRGNKRPVRFLGRIFFPSFMPPSRLHGLARNRMLLFRRHWISEPAWLVYEFVYAAKLLGDILFFEDQKLEKLAACCRGTWAGLFSRSRLSTGVQK